MQAAAQLDLHTKPGPQLASLIRSIFEVEAVAIFDADLNETYQAGEWFADPEQSVRNICVFETVRDDPETGLIRRVLRVREMPIGALQLRGELSAETSSTLAALLAITFDRYHSLANEMRMESAKKTEQLRTTVLDSLAHAYKTPLTAIRAAEQRPGGDGRPEPGTERPGCAHRRADGTAEPADHPPAEDGSPGCANAERRTGRHCAS